MSNPDQDWPWAWEPLTPRGVAAFAGAPFARLFLVQFIVAMLTAGAAAWFLEQSWFPVVRAAIHQLPGEGEIRNEQLDWRGETSVELAENHFLGIAVDLNHSGQIGRESHLQVEFGRKNVRFFSMLGYQVMDYPSGWRVAFNRTTLEPWWGAWQPWILVGAAAATAAALMVSWAVLATFYSVPVKLITLYENRDLSWGQSWRLAGAALMPGALFLTFGLLVYSLNLVDLIQLGGVYVLHFVIGWIYLFVGPLFLPRHPAAAAVSKNPFATKREPAPKAAANPFASKEEPAPNVEEKKPLDDN